MVVGAWCLAAGATQASAQVIPRRDTVRTRPVPPPPVTPAPTPTPPRTPPDTAVRADSARARGDSTRGDTAKVKRDTVKAPLAHGELPTLTDIGERYHWDRTALFATGANTVAELLERVPGITMYRSGGIGTPQQAAYLGDASRVRVFYDGIEVQQLDPRTAGVLDLIEAQLWSAEEVAVERGADEVRVYIRSWRVERTTSNTRTDVGTGDEETNLYRGFFGRRFRHGEVLQFAAQQYGFGSNDPTFGGGDQLAALVRLGWAGKRWSLDASAVRGSRSRDVQRAPFTGDSVAALKAKRQEAYARLSTGDPDRGVWAQLLAVSQTWKESSLGEPVVKDTSKKHQPSRDSAVSRTQYIAAGGLSRWGLRFSLTGRATTALRRTQTDVTGRVAYESDALAVSAFSEQRSGGRPSVQEVSVRFRPLSFLSVGGALSRREGDTLGTSHEVRAARAEGAIRLYGFWVGGGVMLRDTTPLPGLRVFDTAYAVRAVDAERPVGVFGTLRGPVWKAVYADVWAVSWNRRGPYRPAFQSRAEIGVRTDWLSHFPSGNFGFLFSAAYDYRSAAEFPRGDGQSRFSTGQRLLKTNLEIRIIDATLFYQQMLRTRNQEFDIVPGFIMPRQLQFYGIRWQFWG